MATWKNKHLSESHKQHLSESLKGRKKSDDVKIKMSKPNSNEHNKKISLALKGRPSLSKGTHWYNNGKINVRAKDCPEGFIRGRIIP